MATQIELSKHGQMTLERLNKEYVEACLSADVNSRACAKRGSPSGLSAKPASFWWDNLKARSHPRAGFPSLVMAAA